MRILDIYGNDISNKELDLDKGYLVDDRVFIKHHDEVKYRPEEFHYEVTERLPNGQVFTAKVVDKSAVDYQAPYDEYEDIKRYKLYNAQEYAQKELEKNTPSNDERLLALEFGMCDIGTLISNYNAMATQLSNLTNSYNAYVKSHP